MNAKYFFICSFLGIVPVFIFARTLLYRNFKGPYGYTFNIFGNVYNIFDGHIHNGGSSSTLPASYLHANMNNTGVIVARADMTPNSTGLKYHRTGSIHGKDAIQLAIDREKIIDLFGINESMYRNISSVITEQEMFDRQMRIPTPILDINPPSEFLQESKNPCWIGNIFESDTNPCTEDNGLCKLYKKLFNQTTNIQTNRLKTRSPWKLRCIPYFYLIGFPKCGTTDLAARISHHPQILGRFKEFHFWSKLRKDTQGGLIDTFKPYVDMFDMIAENIRNDIKLRSHSDAITGDNSPSTVFFYNGEYDGNGPVIINADIMKHISPSTTKYICILRDPVERSLSEYYYWHNEEGAIKSNMNHSQYYHVMVQDGIRRFEECASNNPLRYCVYLLSRKGFGRGAMFRVALGIYHVFLDDWIKVVGKDALLVLKMEDLRTNLTGVMTSVFDHLDVKPRLENLEEEYTRKILKTCGKVRFSEWPLPLTALASYPGSGNTWTRYILQQATGIYTGSVYSNDDELRLNGFPGEGVTNGSVLVIKTHRALLSHRKYDRIVMIIRSPFQAYLTDFNRRRGHGHTAIVELTEGWSGYVRRQLDTWRAFYVNWMSYARVPFHMIFYEKLRENVRSELTSLLDFLEFPIHEDRIECLMERTEGNFKRQSVNSDRRDIYSSNVTKILREHVAEVCKQYTENIVHEESTPKDIARTCGPTVIPNVRTETFEELVKDTFFAFSAFRDMRIVDDSRNMKQLIDAHAQFADSEGQVGVVRLIGVASRDIPDLYCRLSDKSGNGYSVPARHHAMSRVLVETMYRECTYFPYFVDCPLYESHKDHVVDVVGITDKMCGEVDTWLPVTQTFFDNMPDTSHSVIICMKTLFGLINPSRLIEFLEFSKILGVEKVVIYGVYDIGLDVRDVLDGYIKEGFITIIDWRLPFDPNLTHFFGEKAAINDCLYRYGPQYKYMLFSDFDEYFIPRSHNTLYELFESIEDTFQNPYHPIGAFRFLQTRFCIDSPEPSNDNTHLVTMSNTMRDDPSIIAAKCVVIPKNVVEMDVHTPRQQVSINHKRQIVPVDMAQMHHYRYRDKEEEYCKTDDKGVMRFNKALKQKYKEASDRFKAHTWPDKLFAKAFRPVCKQPVENMTGSTDDYFSRLNGAKN
ncbi:unnamed protein product [Owenia fusiformis]|uniref:Sulfotransferase domain-containing protein n=1 Tax=Owenia fusiformis TaxID=6347 RepID=A0A8S4MUN3_OWEFU|nr:unnamed protein product [Owenia fusiformis]